MSAKIDLRGKSREEISELTKRWRHDQYVDAIYQLATIEPFFSPRTVAKARESSPRVIADLCRNGTIQAHKLSDNVWRIPLSAILAWDRATAVNRT
jgi:hypothetical protein